MGSRQPEELPFPLPGRPDCTRAISVIRNGNIHHHHHIYHNKIIITIVSLYMYIVISSFLDQIRRGKNWIRSKLDRKQQIRISKMICGGGVIMKYSCFYLLFYITQFWDPSFYHPCYCVAGALMRKKCLISQGNSKLFGNFPSRQRAFFCQYPDFPMGHLP